MISLTRILFRGTRPALGVAAGSGNGAAGSSLKPVLRSSSSTSTGSAFPPGKEHKSQEDLKFLSINPALESRYEILYKHFMGKISSSFVDPSGVFANNELDMSEIQVYGFDYDYTLADYKESLHYLIYDLARDFLVNKYGYPEEILRIDYIPDFAIRGLHYDIEHGLLMKLDSFHQIQLGSVYQGLTPVPDEEVVRIYGGTYIPQDKIRGGPNTLQMKQLSDLFSVPEICLLSNVEQFFKKNDIVYHSEMMFHDIQSAVSSIHPVIHEKLTEDQMDQYLEKQPELIRYLEILRSQGRKTFLVTNSPFKFVDVGMRHMIGKEWTELFDVIVAQARKPSFFTQKAGGKCKPFRRYDPETGYKYWEEVKSFESGMVYLEGTVSQMISMTGWPGKSILYFGDQIYADLADITLFYGWRTGAIIHELEKEIKTQNHAEFKDAVARLQAVEQLLEVEYNRAAGTSPSDNCASCALYTCRGLPRDSDLVQALLKDRDTIRLSLKNLFNPQFGSIFRTHQNQTYFSRRLFRYSDIYMSKLTNLLNYSSQHLFMPRRRALVHEKRDTVSQLMLD